MLPRSLRWRLTLSYAGIALLASLSLGAVLLLTLRGYYAQREREHLTGNARAISKALAVTMGDGTLSTEGLQPQLVGMSFLAQARVRVLDPDLRELADSDKSGERAVVRFRTPAPRPEQGASPDEPEQPTLTILKSTSVAEGGESAAGIFEIHLAPDFKHVFVAKGTPLPGGPAAASAEGNPTTGDSELAANADKLAMVPLLLLAKPTIYGLSLDDRAFLSLERRSDQVVRHPIVDPTGGLRGYVELSNGPALGVEIVDSVARGWTIAGSVAVLLAALVGWIVSGRMSAPVLALTEVTTRMASGDLSARADITREDELGRLGRSYNEMADRVEGIVLALRRFVSDAAHEVQTPLTALRTNLELAAGSTDPVDQRAFIERAQEQIDRLAVLVGELLDLSRIEARATDEPHTPVDLARLLVEVSEPYASRAEQADLTFEVDVPAEPVLVPGNEAQLRRALSNLLDNALKFTGSGGRISVRLHRREGDVELSVEDTGIGIPPDDLPQVFSRFHRGRNAAAYPGSGLGLAIVKAIVEAHCGRVTAENVSPGARFALHLPATSPPC